MNKARQEAIEGLGVRIQRLRRERLWSLFELEQRTGIARSHLYAIENGQIENPHALTVIRLAKGFAISLDKLLDFRPQTKTLCPCCQGEGWVFEDTH